MEAPVFILTLKSSQEGENRKLSQRLHAGGFNPIFVQGVTGRELPAGDYFDLVQSYSRMRGLVMTPSEVGCALGHMSVLSHVIEQGVDVAVVLEDDVLIDDVSIQRMNGLLARGFHANGFLSLGGQEGLEHLLGGVHGELVDEENEVWRLMLDDLSHVHRTVGYVISRPLAKSLIELSHRGLYIIDDFSFLCETLGIDEFYISNCVGHPTDLSRSAIQSERLASRADLSFSGTRLLRRLCAEVQDTLAAKKSERNYKRRVASSRKVVWKSRFIDREKS